MAGVAAVPRGECWHVPCARRLREDRVLRRRVSSYGPARVPLEPHPARRGRRVGESTGRPYGDVEMWLGFTSVDFTYMSEDDVQVMEPRPIPMFATVYQIVSRASYSAGILSDDYASSPSSSSSSSSGPAAGGTDESAGAGMVRIGGPDPSRGLAALMMGNQMFLSEQACLFGTNMRGNELCSVRYSAATNFSDASYTIGFGSIRWRVGFGSDRLQLSFAPLLSWASDTELMLVIGDASYYLTAFPWAFAMLALTLRPLLFLLSCQVAWMFWCSSVPLGSWNAPVLSLWSGQRPRIRGQNSGVGQHGQDQMDT